MKKLVLVAVLLAVPAFARTIFDDTAHVSSSAEFFDYESGEYRYGSCEIDLEVELTTTLGNRLEVEVTPIDIDCSID